jgi:diacylglycerol kinase (ATP)
MKYLLIVNPLSGDGSALSKVESVLDYFRRRGDEIEFRPTDRPGHAIEIAREASRGDWDVIIGAGGDGTINEVLNGMIGGGRRLAILPWGTGNVFASEMRFPSRLSSLCRLIRRGRSARLDLGKCGDRHFLLMVGAGVDAYSLKQIDGQSAKRRMGMLAYAGAALKAFARYRFPEIRVRLADGREDSGSFILVSNTCRYGRFFSFTPRATPMDGLLDVFVFRETGRWNTMLLAIRYFLLFITDRKRRVLPLALQRYSLYRVEGLSLSSSKPVFTQADGELNAPLPAEIRVVPAAIDIILPSRSLRRYARMATRAVPQK